MSVYRGPPCNLLHAATPSNTIRSTVYPENGGVPEEGGGAGEVATPPR
jgi:hypothetical protein